MFDKVTFDAKTFDFVALILQAVSGVLSSAGALSKLPWKLLAGTVTSTGILVRNIWKSFAGAMTSAGALVTTRIVSKVITGVLDFTGALGAIRMRIVWRRQLKDFVGRELKDFTGRELRDFTGRDMK